MPFDDSTTIPATSSFRRAPLALRSVACRVAAGFRRVAAGLCRAAFVPLAACLAILCAAPAVAQDFSSAWGLEPGADSLGAAVGDLDGDGDLDAYVCDFFGPDTAWINDGAGDFRAVPHTGSGAYGSFPQLGDLDGDGVLDLVVRGQLAPNRIYQGLGDGGFALVATLGSTDSGRRGALGDLDGDGDLDIVSAGHPSGAGSEVLRNEGGFAFTVGAQQLGASLTTHAVALADLDADGDLDAVMGQASWPEIWRNRGTGRFVDSGRRLAHGGTRDLALGDLDGDGDLDIVQGSGALWGEQNKLWLRDGTVFVDSGQVFPVGYTHAVDLGDLDGDGDLDLVTGTSSGESNRVFLNDGAGVLTESTSALGLDGLTDVLLGDIDGDGDLDVLTVSGEQPDVVWWNNGAAVFTRGSQRLGSGRATSVALGDFDGDGILDAAVGHLDGIVHVLGGDGAGGFDDLRQRLVQGTANSTADLVAGDFDGDGDLDLFTVQSGNASYGGRENRLWVNNGGGFFNDSQLRLGDHFGVAIAAGDLDGNGTLEAVVAAFGDNHIWKNEGGGVVSDTVLPGTGNSQDVVLGDVDGDGDLDLVVGNFQSADEIWLNDGSGAFVDSGQSLGAADAGALALGDLDGDGDLDLWVGNRSADTVWLNDGTGTFTDSGQSLGPLYHTVGVHLLDIDGDGDLDAWTTHGAPAEQASTVWLNDGAAGFTVTPDLYGLSHASASAAGDLDGDGDLDILVVSSFGDHRSWLQN